MRAPALLLLALACGRVRAEATGVLAPDALTECSGLAASRRHPGVLWAHNDSGDGPRLFALREDGTLVASFSLTGAESKDWEDIALGPGPDPARDYLYIGDIGNNCRCRDDLSVYRIPEPELPATPPADEIPVTGYERFRYRFPDKTANAEALLVDPRDGGLYLVDKVATNSARLWRFPMPLAPGASVTLEEAARLALPVERPCRDSYFVTGGDVSPDGSAVALTTYTGVFLWKRRAGESLAAALRRAPAPILSHVVSGTEALAIRPDGASYVVTTEGAHARIEQHPLKPVRRTRARRGLLDDFEDGDLDNSAGDWSGGCHAGRWFIGPLGSSTLFTPTLIVEPERNGRGRVLHAALPPHSGDPADRGYLVFGGLAWDWGQLDLTPATGLRFRARAEAPRAVHVGLEGRVGDRWYTKEAALIAELPVTAAWKTYALPWSAFAQARTVCPGPACLPAFRPTGVMVVRWEVEPGPWKTRADLWLDDVELTY